MKKIFCTDFRDLVNCSGVGSAYVETDDPITSKNATGMDGVCDFQRITNVINNASPDVVAIAGSR